MLFVLQFVKTATFYIKLMEYFQKHAISPLWSLSRIAVPSFQCFMDICSPLLTITLQSRSCCRQLLSPMCVRQTHTHTHTSYVRQACHLLWLLLSDTHVFISYSMDAVHRWCVMLHTLLFWQTGNDTPTCTNAISMSSEYKQAIFDQTLEGHCSCSKFLLWMIESLYDRGMPCNVLFTAARDRFFQIQSDYCCHYASYGRKTRDSDEPRQRKLLLRVKSTLWYKFDIERTFNPLLCSCKFRHCSF